MVWRIGWTVITTVVVQTMICGASVLPVIVIWTVIPSVADSSVTLRVVVLSLALIPSYVLFALLAARSMR